MAHRRLPGALGLLSLAAVLAASGGCAKVAPWQRGRFARPEMALEPCAELRALREHAYQSREAGAVGGAAGGSACRCY